MEDRFPQILLVVFGIATVLVLVFGAIGFLQDGGPDFTPDDALERARKKAERVKRGENPGTAPRKEPESFEIVPPPPARVVATWETLELDSQSATPLAAPTPLVIQYPPRPRPPVKNRFRVVTPGTDGGVTGVTVTAGTPLRFALQPEGDGSTTVVTYEGSGRHPRITALKLGSGTRVLHVLTPRATGTAHPDVTVTPPARLAGTVVDEGGPLASAIVRIGDRSATTDDRGRFAIEDVRGTQVVAYVEAADHAIHREVLTTPPRFGMAQSPAFSPTIRLARGARLTVEVAYPGDRREYADAYKFHLIPFGHRLATKTLAVEKLGPFTTTGGRFVFRHFPRGGTEMCIVGTHPELGFIYRRLARVTSDLTLTLKSLPTVVIEGQAVNADTGQPIDSFGLETSLDGVTVGHYLEQTRQLPADDTFGDFPLPTLDQPLVRRQEVEAGRFKVVCDPNVAPRLRLRARGFRPATVVVAGQSRSITVEMTPITRRRVVQGSIQLVVTLDREPKVESFRSIGLDAAPAVLGPGRVEVSLTDVPAGQYKLTVEADGYKAYKRTLRISTTSVRRVPAFLPHSND